MQTFLEEELFVQYIIQNSSETKSTNVIFKKERTIGKLRRLMCIACILPLLES